MCEECIHSRKNIVRLSTVMRTNFHLFVRFQGDNSASAVDVIVFVREVVETYPDLRQGIVGKLLQSMDQIKSAKVGCISSHDRLVYEKPSTNFSAELIRVLSCWIKVYRGALWIIGEYSVSLQDIEKAFTTVKKVRKVILNVAWNNKYMICVFIISSWAPCPS